MCTKFIVFLLSLFQVDYDMTDNVYMKEKKPLNQLEEHLKSLEEEYHHAITSSVIGLTLGLSI